MKIAVSSTGTDLNSEVDARFGRAKVFLIVDEESGSVEFVQNTQNIDAAQGAGIQSARTVAEAGAEVVLTGHCGPKAFKTLNAAGIKIVVGCSGTVSKVLEQYRAGELKPADNADVDGHWA